MEGIFSNRMHKEMRRTLLKLIILTKASRSRLYPYSLIKKLISEKMFYSDDTEIKNDVYNAVSTLEHFGLIKMSERTGKGRNKTYYSITKKGRDALKTAMRMRLKMRKYTESLMG
ncbi:MAG: helix-turn-helix transcriptional regulator [Candidatus Micrarchaeota archaeon]|nr:helix-turn-helix transcriptional regulator [Candidatus Micrarchaeota archaeon]MDE1824449.1 helix-turn-helix transcriptional regulator [Candidatus Micrarchaeota archaeon]MDE1849618.1 helix-turn-helix transcriptional regulator [Candidatus Micrarchaeota archaeon]